MAPVTEEYVPAKARNEEYKRLGEHNGRRRREDKILVSKWYKGVGAPQGKTKERGVGKTRTCNQSRQSMAPAGHEVTAEEPAGQ